MVNQNYIDNIAETIAKQTEALQKEMVRDLLKLSKDTRFKSIDEFLLAIDQLDLDRIVRLKAQNIMQGYTLAHTQILNDMTLFAEITEETLRALTNFSTSTFADHLGSMGNVFKRELIKGAISGATETGIFQAIQEQAGLSNRQMRTMVTTGLNDYTRSVGKIMMDSAAKNKRYRYVGPIDGKTRNVCLELWGAGEMTQKQIESGSWGASVLVEGGGYNCRHVFVPIDVEDKSKDFRREDA